jgi:hypothetical protein
MIIKNYSKFQHQLPQCFPAHRLDLWASLVVCGACMQASAEQLSCAIQRHDMYNDAAVLSSSGGGTTAGCDGKLVLKHSMFVLALLLSSSQSTMWQALVVEPIQRSIRYRVDADEDSYIYSHEMGKTELILPGGLTRKSNCSQLIVVSVCVCVQWYGMRCNLDEQILRYRHCNSKSFSSRNRVGCEACCRC